METELSYAAEIEPVTRSRIFQWIYAHIGQKFQFILTTNSQIVVLQKVALHSRERKCWIGVRYG